MTRPDPTPTWRRPTAELALLFAAGLFMGAIGPYGTNAMPAGARYFYWIVCIVGGGAIGVAADAALGRRALSPWRRWALASLLMTPAVTLFVMAVGRAMTGAPLGWPHYLHMLWQVFVISALVMGVRALAWRKPQVVVETRTTTAPPLPEAEAVFRRRLSARRRCARMIAVEAHDHYLRVHTDAGPELVALRFADALKELSQAHGFQTHRSWWVAADAIETVRWKRGAGVAHLAGGLAAPVSRSHAPALREAGWF